LERLYEEGDAMKKMLAVGGIVAAPMMLLAIPQIPNLAIVLVSLGFGFLTLTQTVVLGLLVVLGSFFGGGNLLAALLAFA